MTTNPSARRVLATPQSPAEKARRDDLNHKDPTLRNEGRGTRKNQLRARYTAALVTPLEQAARRWERKVRSIGLRASARAARKWSRAASGRPARSSNSPRAA